MTGSSLLALRVGATPKNTPTAADTPNDGAIDHHVIEAGTSVNAAIASEPPTPSTIPMSPPIVASSTASASRGRKPRSS